MYISAGLISVASSGNAKLINPPEILLVSLTLATTYKLSISFWVGVKYWRKFNNNYKKTQL